MVFRPLDPGRTGVDVYPGVPHHRFGDRDPKSSIARSGRDLACRCSGSCLAPLSPPTTNTQRTSKVVSRMFLNSETVEPDVPCIVGPHPLGTPGSGPRASHSVKNRNAVVFKGSFYFCSWNPLPRLGPGEVLDGHLPSNIGVWAGSGPDPVGVIYFCVSYGPQLVEVLGIAQ